MWDCKSRQNRNAIWKINMKMEKGELKTRNLDGGIHALQWIDKRAVTMLSTFHDSSTSTIQRRSCHTQGIDSVHKPIVIQDYNKYMGKVNQSDQMLLYYGFSNRTIKWWRRAFFHLLDLSIVNAYILYKQHVNARCSHEQFRVELAKLLLFKSGQQAQCHPAYLWHRSSLHWKYTSSTQRSSNTKPMSTVQQEERQKKGYYNLQMQTMSSSPLCSSMLWIVSHTLRSS